MRKFTITSKAPKKFVLDLEKELNEEQLAAVTSGDGPKLIIAGAGTGKTRTITYRVAYLMMRGVPASAIMLATFTNKAAREMLSRVESLTGNSISRIWGGTFHSLGNRCIRENAQLVGFDQSYSILDEGDQKEFLKLCTKEARIKPGKDRFPSPAVLRGMFSLAFNTEHDLDDVIDEFYSHFEHWSAEIAKVGHMYTERKRKANALDYDDLLRYWRMILRDYQDVRERYGKQFHSILVDEYQDTNKVQAEIVELLASANGNNLMVVGDDCQSIYAFRGAHFENILHYPDRNPGTEIFKLETNYRSTPEILRFTNESIRQNEQQFHKTLMSVKPSGFFPTVVPLNDVHQEAAFICERLSQLQDEGVGLNEIAVLYRAHSHSMILQTELARRNVSYEVRSGMRFFEQAHVKDVISYLKVIQNPRDEISWRRLFLMLPKVGPVSADRIWAALTEHADPLSAVMTDDKMLSRVPGGAINFWRRFSRDLRILKETADTQEPSEIIDQILETGYMDFLCSRYDNYPSRIDDIKQLALFSKDYQTLNDLVNELVLLGELYQDEVGARKERGGQKLVLSSIHQAKGLEWKTVFIMRLHDAAFPSPMALKEDGGIEEERRIFYVAATRAKDELYLTYPIFEFGDSYFGGALRPSRFIQEIDQVFYENTEVTERDPEQDCADYVYS